MASHTSSVFLTEALPWPSSPPGDGRCFLVCDSVESNGRFLLYTLTSQVLLAHKSTIVASVLWVSGGPCPEHLITNALKKMDVTAHQLRRTGVVRHAVGRGSEEQTPLRICCVPAELGERLSHEDSSDVHMELYMKELYHNIRVWAAETRKSSWLVLDDVSALAGLVGERLSYAFVSSVKALAARTGAFGLMVRCSQDFDQILMKARDDNWVRPGGSFHVDWMAAGGRGPSNVVGDRHIPWERHLIELADGVVDVLPLASGYSREAHGRLVFTVQPGGRGWGIPPNSSGNYVSPHVMNYSCYDTSISAIRL